MATTSACPIVTGVSPKDGIPGTQVTIRGENLGSGQSDLVALIICGTDCLVTAKWKSPSKIVARVGQAKRGLGDIILVTKSGGRGTSNVQFRVFFEQVGPLAESSVWVDETRTVPIRNAIRNVTEAQNNKDILGISTGEVTDQAIMQKYFPDSSGNLRMNNFNPAWYILESYKSAKMSDIMVGISNLKKEIMKEKQSSKDVHKSNLYSLIHCVDALDTLHKTIESDCESHGWPLTTSVAERVNAARETSDKLFSGILSRKDKADATRNALSVLTRFRFIFYLIENIEKNLNDGDYAAILSDYSRAKSLFKDTEISLFKEVMDHLNVKIQKFKETLQQRLMGIPTSLEEQSKLIKYLMILDPDSNPGWNCVTTYHCWLEDQMWELQEKYVKMSVDKNYDQSANDNQSYINSFVSEFLGMLCEKLVAFTKLASIYTTANQEDNTEDVNQMIRNSINLGSWLVLNAIVPEAIPQSVKDEYGNRFAKFNDLSRDGFEQVESLIQALKTVRSSLKTLLESQFSRHNVQPLIELSKTLRIKGIEVLTTTVVEGILALSTKENWKIDYTAQNFKTLLPDLYEAKINEMLPSTKLLLTSNGVFEDDLFINDSIRQLIVDRYMMVVCTIKECLEQMLAIKLRKRPHRLFNESDSGSTNSAAVEEQKKSSSEVNGRRLLIAISNLDYILNGSLPQICKKLSDNGLKYSDLILDKAKGDMSVLRSDLISKYLELKTGPLLSLLDCISYEHLPEEDDVSAYIKELVMGMIFVKAELNLVIPAISSHLLQSAIRIVLKQFVKALKTIIVRNDEHATQIVIDVTAVEEAFDMYIDDEVRRVMNDLRAPLKAVLDRELFEESMTNFKGAMFFAIESISSNNHTSDV
ncbi:unnamed protein product [Bursaphelenchus okinawaensis]|uniref:Exocyst complex component 2 n=1 Tax=Bursaphelenchus okinawaensis TaxID=465554 RepID=A0A811JTW3_9BILA|nr:unnamed protein product [Bursaphelenchus okinawaensis]CAG9082355.1 unnamed protein product [Bursaphelenchus okinawaensis]